MSPKKVTPSTGRRSHQYVVTPPGPGPAVVDICIAKPQSPHDRTPCCLTLLKLKVTYLAQVELERKLRSSNEKLEAQVKASNEKLEKNDEENIAIRDELMKDLKWFRETLAEWRETMTKDAAKVKNAEAKLKKAEASLEETIEKLAEVYAQGEKKLAEVHAQGEKKLEEAAKRWKKELAESKKKSEEMETKKKADDDKRRVLRYRFSKGLSELKEKFEENLESLVRVGAELEKS